MPKILPLLERKQKELYSNLQVKVALPIDALRTFLQPVKTNTDPMSHWALLITPTIPPLIKATKEYDDLINALILEKE